MSPAAEQQLTYVDLINALELIWWPIVGIVVARRSYHQSPRWRLIGYVAAVCLILFGLSDGVELFTRAWWKPWWLLIWKGSCITALIACAGIRHRLLRHKTDQPQNPD